MRVSVNTARNEVLDKLLGEMKQDAESAAAKNLEEAVKIQAEAETEDYDITLDEKNFRS